MVSIKEATANAMAFATAALGPARTLNIQLEEVESTPDLWIITLSMTNVDLSDLVAPSALTALLRQGKRDYKIFTVRKDDGEVQSMKIRELADA